MGIVNRGEVYLVNLNPTVGSEVRKARPCAVISPNEMNNSVRTIVVAPMTTKRKGYKSRVSVTFKSKEGEIMLDQMRAIDKKRLISKLGKLSVKDLRITLSVVQEMFAY